MRSSWLLRTGGFGAVALLLAGCGGSSSAASGTSASSSAATSSAASSSAAPTAEAPPAADRLQAVLVQQADVPAGWTGEAYTPDPSDAQQQAAFLQCAGGRDTSPDQVSEQHSPDFSAESGAGVSSQATSYKTQQDVDDDVALLTGPKASTCFQDQAKSALSGASLPPGATLSNASIAITPGAAGGPANVVATGTGRLLLSISGQKMPLYLGVSFITARMTEVEVDFFSLGSPVDPALMSSVTRTVATRAAGL